MSTGQYKEHEGVKTIILYTPDGGVTWLPDPTGGDLTEASLLGLMATPASSVASGIPSSGSSEVYDSTLGDYVWTALAQRRYRVTLSGNLINGTAAGDQGRLIIRDGGASTPTSASPAVTGTQMYIPGNGGSFQTFVDLSGTFTTTAGVHTFGVFTQRANGTGVVTMILAPNSIREMYVEDIGRA